MRAFVVWARGRFATGMPPRPVRSSVHVYTQVVRESRAFGERRATAPPVVTPFGGGETCERARVLRSWYVQAVLRSYEGLEGLCT